MGRGALCQRALRRLSEASPQQQPQLCPSLQPSTLSSCKRAEPENCTQQASPHSTSSWEDSRVSPSMSWADKLQIALHPKV